MSNFELLEEACDNVANAIDELKGNTDFSMLAFMIDKPLEDLDFSREEFIEMFENLYECDPYQYVKNAYEDALWAQEHPEDII